tara:strand:- start:8176 stop:9306 length:1131 start_codon:yes stop_codon:yes gene_type:complete
MNQRTLSLLNNKTNLEHLHTFKYVPISMGCISTPQSDDIIQDQIWDICEDTGIIQLRNPLPLELVYAFPHNDGIGKVWENHYQSFANFISKFKVNKILEIGGGAGRLGKLYLDKSSSYSWTMVEPNHSYQTVNNPNFTHVMEWFDEDFKIESEYDAVVHSHVFEHTYDPLFFLETIHKQIDDTKLHIFSFPNLFKFLENRFTNALNFEHTAFLTEEITDILLKRVGFELIKKEYYGEHSIFYACKKTTPQNISFPNSIYQKNKDLFLNYVKYYQNEVKELNRQIEKYEGEVFLFGGHIFSQFLIFNGLDITNISCILDNSTMKQGNRLYGTSLTVNPPNILKNYNNPAVILKTASYNKEIKNDILSNINNNTIFFE